MSDLLSSFILCWATSTIYRRNFEAFVHLVKGNLGTGLLALPYAVSKVGFIVSNCGVVWCGVDVSYVSVVVMTVYCIISFDIWRLHDVKSNRNLS